MIAYKVVSKGRYGTNAALCGEKFIRELIEQHSELSPYFPKYKKGSIVKAVRGSIGICCFKTEDDAWRFHNVELAYMTKESCKVLRVEGKNPKKWSYTGPELIRGVGGNPHILLPRNHDKRYRPAPEGFISFSEVKVLD